MDIMLDHIAIAAARLEDGVAWVEEQLGVRMSGGGEHAAMGTHNRLLSLGPSEYLEVIAVNPEAPRPKHARWFGLDRFEGSPRAVAWVMRATDLDALRLPEGVGAPMALSRGELSWRLTVPTSGEGPFDGLYPSLIEWAGVHPAPRLPDLGLRLTALEISHPEITALAASLPGRDRRLHFAHGTPGLRLRLNTPEGERLL
ncbi:VOC family protein [Phaeovulum sp.]|uniref:VOC family protein n=1 Tax=Phaeovulum sp. TaxID=2934796 RepID=UPI003569C08F